MRMSRKWLALALLPSAAAGSFVVIAMAPWADSGSRPRSDLENVLDLSTQPPEMAATYHYVEDHADMARQIPCYCGCGKAIGHRNLVDCFVISPGVYSDHAAGCMVCGNEANDVRRLAGEGRSGGEIRDWIDNEYSKYGAPTDTPKRGTS